MVMLKRLCIAAMLILAALLPGITTPAVALAANTRIVDNYYPSTTACPGAGYKTIQGAIDSFAPGESGTIKVCAGGYVENVTATGLGKIKLMGDPGAAIVASGTAALISAVDTAQLTVQGFTLDGAGSVIPSGIINIQNSGSVITKNIFQNTPGGGYGVYSVITTGTRTVSITGNQFVNVDTGVYATSTSGGALSVKVTGNFVTRCTHGVFVGATTTGNTTVTVTDNHVQGTTATGITVGGVNKGTVSGNTVQDFATGIQLQSSNHITVSKNKLLSPVVGIEIVAIGAGSSASSNSVSANTIEPVGNGFYGIYIHTSGAAAADLNQITGNTITDPAGAFNSNYGLILDNPAGSLNKTAIKSNKVININSPYAHNGDTLTTISGNKCTPIAPCIP